MVEKLGEKKVDGYTYQLRFFKGDRKYVIYKADDAAMQSGGNQRIPEEAVFDDETKAMEYFESL